MIITLCGSVRFAREFLAEHRRLSLLGHVVLLPALPGEGDETDADLGALHRQKIDLSDGIHVVDVDGYVGDATRAEIAYARRGGRSVTYLSHEV